MTGWSATFTPLRMRYRGKHPFNTIFGTQGARRSSPVASILFSLGGYLSNTQIYNKTADRHLVLKLFAVLNSFG